MAADAGMVRIQAQTILPATFQCTERSRGGEPTPTVAKVCAVDTGILIRTAPGSVKLGGAAMMQIGLGSTQKH